MSWRARLKETVGPRWTTVLRCIARGKPLPRWGNLRRTQPLSSHFGFDRGTPIDRYYLGRFLERHRRDITGDVLEIQSAGTARDFGAAVRSIETVDVVASYRPTYVCDLADADGVIASSRYDCFLLPNTLNHLRRLDACLAQALRVVRPGGVILASAATFVPLTPLDDAADYWHLSPAGWGEVAARAWPGCAITVEGHGNCLAAIAALHGIAVEELDRDELDEHDPRYPVLVTVACRKPGALG
jgi:hypothetical protein